MLASLIRTVVPVIVGVLLTLLAKGGLDDLVVLDDPTELVTILVTAAYYAIVRCLEATANPRFGWLLGYASPPKHATPAQAAAGLAPVEPSKIVAQPRRRRTLAFQPVSADAGITARQALLPVRRAACRTAHRSSSSAIARPDRWATTGNEASHLAGRQRSSPCRWSPSSS